MHLSVLDRPIRQTIGRHINYMEQNPNISICTLVILLLTSINKYRGKQATVPATLGCRNLHLALAFDESEKKEPYLTSKFVQAFG